MNASIEKQIADLVALVTELKARLEEKEKAVQDWEERYKHLTQSYNMLLSAFKNLQRREFGKRSERFVDKHPEQMDLFSPVPAVPLSELEKECVLEEEKITLNPIKSKRKKKRKPSPFFKRTAS